MSHNITRLRNTPATSASSPQFSTICKRKEKTQFLYGKSLSEVKTLLRTLCWYNSPLVGVQHLPCHKWWNFLQSKRCQAQNTLEHVYIHSTWAGPNGTWFSELHNLTQLPKYNCSNPVKESTTLISINFSLHVFYLMFFECASNI